MSWLNELEKLGEMREKGLLSEEEFQERKAAIKPPDHSISSTQGMTQPTTDTDQRTDSPQVPSAAKSFDPTTGHYAEATPPPPPPSFSSVAVTTTNRAPMTAGVQNWWSFSDLSLVGDKLAALLRRLALIWLVFSWIGSVFVLIWAVGDYSPFMDQWGDTDVPTALGFTAGYAFGMTIYGFLILAAAYLVGCKAEEQRNASI